MILNIFLHVDRGLWADVFIWIYKLLYILQTTAFVPLLCPGGTISLSYDAQNLVAIFLGINSFRAKQGLFAIIPNPHSLSINPIYIYEASFTRAPPGHSAEVM